MFTGLIKDVGTIKEVVSNDTGKIFTISTSKLISEIGIDDSVATNGVCLTATEVGATEFKTQAVHITLEKSNLGELAVGNRVNLELALRATDRLGGHLVQGHVNGKGKLLASVQRGGNWEMEFEVPTPLRKYFIDEGSIAIDGISLTVAQAKEQSVVVSIIPHTYENTTLGVKNIGDSVNIEVDMVAKYLENFTKFRDS